MEPVKNFVQRDALLDEIRSQLTQNSDGKQLGIKKVGVWGIGGSGKSQLARSYLQSYGKEYDATFWVQAISRVTLEQGFQEIYHTLPEPKLTVPDTIAKACRAAVLNWFAMTPGRWLLVFDEADHPNHKDKEFIQLSSANSKNASQPWRITP